MNEQELLDEETAIEKINKLLDDQIDDLNGIESYFKKEVDSLWEHHKKEEIQQLGTEIKAELTSNLMATTLGINGIIDRVKKLTSYIWTQVKSKLTKYWTQLWKLVNLLTKYLGTLTGWNIEFTISAMPSLTVRLNFS